MPDEDWKSVVTEILAAENEKPAICETKTRVLSRPQKEWDSAQDRLFQAWKWPWLNQEKTQDERLMMAHQGKRSDDLVEVAKSSGENKVLTRGLRAMRGAFKEDTPGAEA
jgi:hypothetical protein